MPFNVLQNCAISVRFITNHYWRWQRTFQVDIQRYRNIIQSIWWDCHVFPFTHQSESISGRKKFYFFDFMMLKEKLLFIYCVIRAKTVKAAQDKTIEEEKRKIAVKTFSHIIFSFRFYFHCFSHRIVNVELTCEKWKTIALSIQWFLISVYCFREIEVLLVCQWCELLSQTRASVQLFLKTLTSDMNRHLWAPESKEKKKKPATYVLCSTASMPFFRILNLIEKPFWLTNDFFIAFVLYKNSFQSDLRLSSFCLYRLIFLSGRKIKNEALRISISSRCLIKTVEGEMRSSPHREEIN